MRKVMFVLVVLCVMCVGMSPAGVINIDFDRADSLETYSGQGVYPDPGNDYWNSVSVDLVEDLIESDGTTVTGVSIEVFNHTNFHNPDAYSNTLFDYVYNSDRSTEIEYGNLTISGLEADTPYLVYAYVGGDATDQPTTLTLNDVTVAQTSPVYMGEDFVEGPEGNYFVMEVTSDATGVINGAWTNTDGDRYSSVRGLQIIDAITRGAAHSPDPTGDSVDPAAVSVVSWYSPEQDTDGTVIDDPNLTVVGYDVWWSVGAEPNYVDDSPTYQAAPDQDYAPGPLDYETTYYWRVDTHVVWDSNEITGNFSDIIESRPWQFTTKPEYLPPTVTMANVVTTLDLDAYVSAVVEDNSTEIASVEFIVLDDDVEWPGTAPVQTDDSPMDMQNPGTTLSGLAEGTYKVKLVVTDTGTETDGPTTVETIAEVTVYADACAAKQGDESSDWVQSEYDVTGPEDVPDCLVNLLDFVEFAKEWLDNSSLLEQETYEGTALYVPQAVYDARIDAVADIIDPNVTCSDAPITDTEGIQIETDRVNATDSTNLGSAATDSWVEYEVTLDAGTYDVYAGYSCDSGAGQELSFGIDGEPAKYGTVFLPATGSWDTFWGHYVGEVTFTESGTQTVRTTYGGYSNMDWFAFDPQ